VGRRVVILLACATAVATLPATLPGGPSADAAPSTLITPVQVLGGPQSTLFPSSNGTWLIYTTNTVKAPKHWDEMAKNLSTGHIVKVNAPGTQGFAGTFDPGTNTVVYQQASGRRSNIATFDLDTSSRALMPGVNTPSWEWQPSVSTGYVEFLRDVGKLTVLLLYNRTTHAIVEVGSEPLKCECLHAGPVGEQWAPFTKCPKGRCRAYIRSTTSGAVRTARDISGLPEYFPAVDEATGDVYLVRSGFGCGRHIRFLKWHIGSLTVSVIATLPPGYDVAPRLSLAPNGSGGTDLLFTRVNCKTGGYDLYKLPGVA